MFNFQIVGINMRDLNTTAIYVHANKQIEKSSQTVYFVFMKLVPSCVMFPLLIHNIFDYFVRDLESDAFKLPFYSW